MNRFDQRKITKNLVALRKAIQNDVSYIADKLHEDKVFSKQTREEIDNVRPAVPQLRCGVLINKLLRSDRDAYSKFRNILQDMGHHDIVHTMEKSVHRGSVTNNTSWTETRDKTFILPNPTLPENKNKPITVQEEDIDDERSTESRIDEVHQLERMMTFVLTNLDSKDRNKNTVDFKKEFKQKLREESKGNEELMGFFTTLRYNSFSLTSQSLVH